MTRVRSSGLLIPVEVFFLFSTIVAIVQVRSTCAIAAACATPCHIGSSAPRACCLVRTIMVDVRARVRCILPATAELQGRLASAKIESGLKTKSQDPVVLGVQV